MLSVQPVLGARDAPHVFAVMEKSPVTDSLVRLAVTPPVFEMVTSCAVAVLPSSVSGKLSVWGESTIAAPGAPVPLSETVTCPAALPPEMFP